MDKKQKYREALINLLQSAETTYDKVIALKAIGNARIDMTVADMEEVIMDKNEDRLVRITAIDALRGFRNQLPRKVQTMLLPLFLNNREIPEVRMAAFSMIINTLPNKQVVSQLAYQMIRERSKHVLSFIYNTMKSLSQSKNPVQAEM